MTDTSPAAMPAVIETHPLDPFLPPAARLLMLGSFPPPQTRWKMPFYYPNLQNDMWRIFGLIFFADRDHFLTADGKGFREAELRTFLAATGIAISDTAQRVERLRGNAADQSLRILEPLNLAALLDRLPACRAIITTGALATATLLTQLPAMTAAPRIGAPISTTFAARSLHLYRLPSSSRAYPLPLAQKATAYRDCFTTEGLLA